MARARSKPLAAAAPPPADVRLMNAVSTAVFVIAALVGLAAAVQWLARAPVFHIAALRIDGDLARNSVPQLRANALPQLRGNFFSVDLQQARAAFEAVPWVRRATVRRVWPDRLAVQLEEHRPVALWAGDGDRNPLLVNSHGELFEANLGDVEDDALPVFEGPPDRAAEMWAMFGRLQPLLAQQALAPQRLGLSARGSWRVRTADGRTVELGRGSDDEVVARTERFVRTVAQLTGRFGKPLVSADLRHAAGYAVRLQGVTTLAASAAARVN